MPFLTESQSSGASGAGAQDIAIVGLACRFAGDCDNAERLWDAICKSRSARTETDRFNASGFQDNSIGKLNSSVTGQGHFLKQDIAAFDANFFSISHNEAIAIDPQQRLMLEVAYEAFENAGLPMESLAGTQTGCYVGNFTSDYREILFNDPDAAPSYTVTGTGAALISNRVSWFFDLKGPSFTLNTACSSSLVALHLACQSLQMGESSSAIVGGSNLIMAPEMFRFFSNLHFLAPDGLCKSFDASGDGYSRGEGVAALILKRVDDAIRDGDPIRAIIRGTGVGQDGRTKGITLPNASAQADLISSTYKAAGLDFKDTHYFEAHGTGTKAGDPLELEAISKTLSTVRTSDKPLIVGSVKANIGHTEATAGLAGVIKGIYILETGIIPPNIHFKVPNPDIKFDEWKLKVPTKSMPFPGNGIRRISVNSFGYSGTNAHVVLDDALSYLQDRKLKGIHFTQPAAGKRDIPGFKKNSALSSLKGRQSQRTRVFVLSAQDQDGLKRQTKAYAKYFQERTLKGTQQRDSNEELRDIAYTLSEKRSHLPWKSYVTASSVLELSAKLSDEKAEFPTSRSTARPRIGMIFTGQGAQWAKMGAELCQHEIFRKSVEEADRYLRTKLGCPWSAMDELIAPDAKSNINLPFYSQTICTVLQVALVDLLESWNITPTAITGHSSGEIGAAYCLGALSKEDSWKIAYYRGLLSSQMRLNNPELHGAMLAVGLGEDDAEAWIDRVSKGQIAVACINSPASCTISGDVAGIDELDALLREEGIFSRKLKVETAYHSHHMATVASPYLQSMQDVELLDAREDRKMYSAVSGGYVEAWELGPFYWVKNLVSQVRFSDSVHELLRPTVDGVQSLENTVDILLEVGPHAALQGPVNQVMKEYGITGVEYLSVLSRGRNAIDTALQAAGALFLRGVDVDINAVNCGTGDVDKPRPLITLPAYAWNHSRTFWGESRLSKEQRLRERPQLSLLGAPCPAMGDSEKLWRGFLRMSEEPWMRDHKIQNTVLYPAAGYIAMAIEAARQTAEKSRVVKSYRLRDINITAAAVLTDDSDVESILQLRPHLTATRDASSTWLEFTVSTANGRDLRQNCSGLLLVEYESSEDSAMTAESNLEDQAARDEYHIIEKQSQSSMDPEEFYKDLESLGLMYGPTFQKVSRVRKGSWQSCCTVDTFDPLESTERPHIIHPATLDASFHLVFAAMMDQGHLTTAMVPKSIDEVIISAQTPYKNGSKLDGFATVETHGFREIMAKLVMLDEKTKQPAVTLKGFCFAAISGMDGPDDEATEGSTRALCSKVIWTPALELLSEEQKVQITEQAVEDAAYQKRSLISDGEKCDVVILEAPNSSTDIETLSQQLVSELKALHPSTTVATAHLGKDVLTVKGQKFISLVELQDPVLTTMGAAEYALFQDLILQCSGLLWISSSADPSGSLVPGLARSVRNEIPEALFRTLQVSSESLASPNALASTIARLATVATPDDEFVEEAGLLKVSRIVQDQAMDEQIAFSLSTDKNKSLVESMTMEQANGPQKLAIQNQGMLDSLCYEADDVPSTDLPEDEVEIDVKATGLNFRDVMVVMGQIPDNLLGFEASGIVTRIGSKVTHLFVGDRVCTLGHGAHRSVLRNKAAFCQVIPDHLSWSWEEASTLPLVHCTAYNALVRVARAEPGQSVLIHAAAGGVGQSAIQIAKHIGMEIFATVGSAEKRKLIQELYSIPDDHIFASRDVSFAKAIMRMTGGRGVDVVLNSLSGEALRQSWHCLASFGTFVEIGMKDILGNTRLDMRPFLKDATFSFFNLSHVLKENPKLMAKIMNETFDLLRQGVTRPISPTTVFSISKVEDAFRLMQTGKHIGKISLSWDHSTEVPLLRKTHDALKLDGNSTYVLVGGLGGLGRSLANFFVDHGARNLCFLSRSGAASAKAQKLVQELEARNVTVKVYRSDVADKASVDEVMSKCSTELPPVRGVVQCAMVLRDVLFEKMSHAQWKESTQPKVDGTWNLHSVMPKDLDFFVTLSSFAGVFGNRTQSNYAAAGAFQDALAYHRRAQGLKAVTVDLGVMRDVGVIAELGVTGDLKDWEEPFGIREWEFHSLMEKVMSSQMQDAQHIAPQVITGFATSGMANAAGINRPFYLDDIRLSAFAKAGQAAQEGSGAAGGKTASLQDQLKTVDSVAAAVQVVIDALTARVAKSMQTTSSEIDIKQPLHSYGVDSLVAIEIRNWILKDVKSNVSLFDILSGEPISALAEKIATASKLLPEGVA